MEQDYSYNAVYVYRSMLVLLFFLVFDKHVHGDPVGSHSLVTFNTDPPNKKLCPG